MSGDDGTPGNSGYGKKAFKRSRSHFRGPDHGGRPGRLAGGGRPLPPGGEPGLSVGEPGAGLPAAARPGGRPVPGGRDPVQDDRSWRFTLDPDGRDPVLGIRYLGEAYDRRETGYPGGVSVPAVVDVPSGALVTNDYQQITLDLATEWTALHRPGAPDLYPRALRDEIDEVMAGVYEDVNNGVYRAGFATGQEEYEAACAGVFRRLEQLTPRLERQRYLVGDTITEADIRLFTTLVRFDAVYHGHFKCNRWKLTENPVLWAYVRDLFQTPDSGTPSTSTTSSATTTRCTPASTRPASCPWVRTWPAGSRPTTGRSWAGGRSARAPRRSRSGPRRRCARGRP